MAHKATVSVSNPLWIRIRQLLLHLGLNTWSAVLFPLHLIAAAVSSFQLADACGGGPVLLAGYQGRADVHQMTDTSHCDGLGSVCVCVTAVQI